MRLPPALARWAGPLSLLDARLAVAIGPMVRVVDELMSRGDIAAATSGAPDGYAGLRQRGSPELLLASEWAVADVAPIEFLRRAAAAELLYLAPHQVEPTPRGRLVALVECGPDQSGAPRLVQLAALVVLAARAERRGTTLAVGVLGDPASTWLDGRTAEVLAAWLQARRADSPGPDEVASAVAEREAVLDAADELWVMTGPRAAAALPGRRRLVVATERAWNEHGATAVDVRVDGHRVELALPDGDVGVRALRGAMLRRPAGVGRGTPPAGTSLPGTARTPFVFTGSSPTLLARGDDPAALYRVRIGHGSASRVKVDRCRGVVVAAAALGRRVLVLVERDGRLRVEVIGKPLGLFDDVSFPADDLGADGDTEPFPPLGLEHGTLLTRLGGRWWFLDERGHRAAEDVLAMSSSRDGQLRVARLRRGGISIGGRQLPGVDVGDARPAVVVGGGLAAWSTEPGRWRFPSGREVVLDDGEAVLGLHEIEGDPALVVLSAAGLALRLRWPAGARTLTAWSGGAHRPSVHPVRPWVAVRRDDGSLEVGDLTTGATIVRVSPT